MSRYGRRYRSSNSWRRHAVRGYSTGDYTAYLTTLRHLAMDSRAEMSALLISYGRVYAEDLTACQGQELTERRLEGSIEYGRELAAEEAEES